MRRRWRHVNRTFKPVRGGEQLVESVYVVSPVDGEPYYDLVEVDGRPAGEADRAQEEKLRKKFRDRVGGRSGIAFDRALIERYTLRLEGRRPLNGRLSWVVAFAPLETPPPVERAVDYALNHCRGRFWIDAEDYGLARIEFKLEEKVGVWAGLLGSVEAFEGSYTQTQLEPGGWLPESMDLRMAGRALLSSLDRRVEMRWCDYSPVARRHQGRGYDTGLGATQRE